MHKSMGKRLFIALNLPKEIKTKLSEVIIKLQSENNLIRCVNPETPHITLNFLGNLDKKTEEQVKLVMQSMSGKFNEVYFKLGKINAFPNLRQPRTIFLECLQLKSNSIARLHELLKEKFKSIGLPADNKLWRSHITLARVKESCQIKLPDDLSGLEGKEFSINTFELMESELKQSGAEHKTVMSFKL